MASWTLRPTTRRTSSADRVDILDGDGRPVALYVQRHHALRMIHDPTEIADETIGLFLEFRDTHGHDEEDARSAAVGEINEGCGVDLDAERDELEAEAAERRSQPENQTSPNSDDDLPF